MSLFVALLAQGPRGWVGEEVTLAGCESVADVADLLADIAGEVRLLLLEQDDEYAAIVRLDAGEEEPRAFVSDAHAAAGYEVARFLVEDLAEPGEEADEDDELAGAHVSASAPVGDLTIVEELGTGAAELLRLCQHEGTLPIDLLLAVSERAGCGAEFEQLRG